MPLPEFTVAIWIQPHRGFGHLIEVDASDVDEGFHGGVFQSFEQVEATQRHARFQPDYPHRELRVTSEQAQQLIELANQIRYSFAEHPHTPLLGGAFFGLRVTRAFQEATIVWHGKFEDQDPEILSLFRAVAALAEA